MQPNEAPAKQAPIAPRRIELVGREARSKTGEAIEMTVVKSMTVRHPALSKIAPTKKRPRPLLTEISPVSKTAVAEDAPIKRK